MDPEKSERIVLAIVTNLNTRFVVLPLRSETVGDVRGTIKSYHMNLFPTWGEVDVNALEVELFGNRSRVADPIPVGHLFWKASQAVIFAELIPSISNTLVELPRLKLACATEPNVASDHGLRQKPDGRTPSPPKRKGLAQGQCRSDLGASSHSNVGKAVLDHKVVDGRHLYDCMLEVAERPLRTKKRGVDDLEIDMGERQIPAQCMTVDVGEPATKKSCVDSGHTVLEHNEPETRVPVDKHPARKSMLVVDAKLKSNSADGPGICQRSVPPLPKKGQEIGLSPSKHTEKDAAVKSARALNFTSESKKKDGSRSASQTGHPVAENLPAEAGLGIPKLIEDSATKTLKALEPKHDSSNSDTSDSGSRSGYPRMEKVQEEPRLVTSKPDDKDIEGNLLAAEASPDSSSSQSGTRTGSQDGINSGKKTNDVEVVGLATPEKRVTSGGPPNLTGVSERGGLEMGSKSRRSTRDENEDSGDKSAELQDNYNSSNSDGSSVESDGEEDSKSVRPRKGSFGNDSDQTALAGDSRRQSSERSESQTLETTSGGSDESDESDEMPPAGRNIDVSTPKDGGGVARSIGRRSLGGSVDPKYQHLLDSQNGFDELISLSQQKSKQISGSQRELQPLAEALDSGAPVSLADDSLSIDLVPDTQVEDLIGDTALPDVQKDLAAAEPVENNIKDAKLSTQESATVRRSVIGKEIPAESVKFGGEDGERLKCRSGPPTSVNLGEASLLLSVKEELISARGGIMEKVLEPGKESTPQETSEDPQNIRAALQLAKLSGSKVVVSNLEASASEKPRRRKQGISGLAGVSAETQIKKRQEESSQHKESPVRGASVVNLHEDDDQRLEANCLSSPNQNTDVAEGLGNFLPALGAKEVITKPESATAYENQMCAQLTEEVAPDAGVGRKKQRKRSHEACEESNTEVPLENIKGHNMKTVEDEPSRGFLSRHGKGGDEAGTKENDEKTPLFEYRDLRKKSNLAIDHNAVEKVMSGLKRDEVAKSPNRNDRQGAEEEQAGLPKEPRLTGWVCTICKPSIAYKRKGTLLRHIQKAHNMEKGDIPSELVQEVEINTDGKEEVDNRSKDYVGVDEKESAMGGKKQLEDTEPPNLGFEDLSGLLRRESIDQEIEKEGLRLAGPVKELRSQENVEVQFYGESTRKKKLGRKKLSVEFSENSGSVKQSSKGKRDQDSIQNPDEDPSAFLPQEGDVVSDKSPQVQDTEEEEMKGGEDRLVSEGKHGNVAEEDEADEEHPVVLNEQKKNSRKVGKSSKSSKKGTPNASLKTDENVGRSQIAAEHATVSLGLVTVATEEAHLPRGFIDNLLGKHSPDGVSALRKEHGTSTDGTGTVPSRKSKRKRDKLKVPKNQSNGEVAEEIELLANTALETEDEQPIDRSRDERQDPNETSLKKKTKKPKNPDPHIEGKNNEGELIEGQQELVDDEDQIATPLSQEAVKNANLEDSNRNTAKKRSRNKKIQEEVFLQEEDGMPLEKKKVSDSKNSETVNLAKRPQKTTSAGKKPVNSMSKNRVEGITIGDSAKRQTKAQFQGNGISCDIPVDCPHGCGKVFTKKTSAYFRHQRACVLSRIPNFG